MAEGRNSAQAVEGENGRKYFVLDFKLRQGGQMTWAHEGFATVVLVRVSGNRFRLELGNPKSAGEKQIVVPGEFEVSKGGLIIAPDGSVPV